MTTNELLDQVKARHGLPSDYALAKLLGWTPQAVSNYRNRGRSLGDLSAIQVAGALEVDPGYVLAVVSAERAQTEEARRAWERAARRLSGALAGVLAFWLIGVALPDSTALAASGAPWGLLIMSSAAAAAVYLAYFGLLAYTFAAPAGGVAAVVSATLKARVLRS